MTTPASLPNGTRRRRSPWPLLVLVVLLIAVPIFEVWLLITVGHVIGAWPTIGILVLEALLGGWLMKREGARAWKALNQAFGNGRMPTGELADAALILVGGVLLLLPGFLTDIFGFFFLLPFTRPWARKTVAFFVARRIHKMGINVPVIRAKVDGENLVEGEVADPQPQTDPQRPAGDSDRPISGEILD